MNKILLIIQREYLTRIQKKSFWISSILTPLIFTAIYAIPIWLATRDKEVKKIEVVDQSGLFNQENLKDRELEFVFVNKSQNQIQKAGIPEDVSAIMWISKDILQNNTGLQFYSQKPMSLILQENLEDLVQSKVRQELLSKAGINKTIYENTQVKIKSKSVVISEEGAEKDSSSGGIMILSGILGFILYLTVLIYGSQVMNGVIEEKSSRIIEVLISSVKPFQLMMGKILGLGLVGITQFLLWAVLTFSFSQIATQINGTNPKSQVVVQSLPKEKQQIVQNEMANSDSLDVMKVVDNVLNNTNIPLVLFSFLFYYLFGYLLYSSIFAAIGSAVESPAEAQQFTMVVTIPIIISFFLAQITLQEPDSTLAFWASIFPLTSPVNMIVRIPFGVPVWELILSMALLIIGFLGISWISARIYRVGILMYGKKASWKELRKWMFYKI